MQKRPDKKLSTRCFTFGAILLFTIFGLLSSGCEGKTNQEVVDSPLSRSISASKQVDLYAVWEMQVINPRKYSNPFNFTEIELQATFTAPSRKKINFFGFYDGDGSGGQDRQRLEAAVYA